MLSTNERTVTGRSKGGRTRVFSNEERKNRNRQAQAAFRDRRANYVKVLESTIQQLESQLVTLQQSSLLAKLRTKQVEDKYALLENDYIAIKQAIDSLLSQTQTPYVPSLPCLSCQYWISFNKDDSHSVWVANLLDNPSTFSTSKPSDHLALNTNTD